MRMQRMLGLLAASLWLLAAPGVVPAHAVRIHAPAPDFILKDLLGNRQSLSAYRGKVVILNFWSVTCAPCVAEIPSLDALYREHGGEGLVVLGIALDPAEKPVSDLVARLKVTYPNMLDSNREVYFDTYALFGQPISIIVDRSGTVREKIVGEIEWTSPRVKDRILSYLKGR